MKANYKVIKNQEQYQDYCNRLESMVMEDEEKYGDEIELLTLLIEKWDHENLPQIHADPVQLIKALMKQNDLKSKDLAEILEVNKSTVSRILNYQKGLSKRSIRILARHFSISQNALNQPYRLKSKATV